MEYTFVVRSLRPYLGVKSNLIAEEVRTSQSLPSAGIFRHRLYDKIHLHALLPRAAVDNAVHGALIDAGGVVVAFGEALVKIPIYRSHFFSGVTGLGEDVRQHLFRELVAHYAQINALLLRLGHCCRLS